jgi:hypothetical protein
LWVSGGYCQYLVPVIRICCLLSVSNVCCQYVMPIVGFWCLLLVICWLLSVSGACCHTLVPVGVIWYLLSVSDACCQYLWCLCQYLMPSAKVGDVLTFWASGTNTNLPIVSTDLFHGF